MMRIFLSLVAALGLLASLARAAEAPLALFVLTGDQHSAYARTAQFVAQIDRLKAENPGVPLAVLIDGDSLELGNVIAQRSEAAVDLAMFAALARRAPTVVNLGNHEADLQDVPAVVAQLRAAGVVVIGNLRSRATGELFAPASARLTLGATEVVIAGVTTDVLAQYRAAVRPSLDLAAPGAWAREKFPGLLAVAPVKIVLSHAGLRLDREMFPFVPDGTLFAGAHDHTQFVQPLGRSVYVQSGSWNSHLSVVRLQRDASGPVWTVEQRPLRDRDPADAGLAALIRATTDQFLTPEDLAPLGNLPAELSRTEAAAFVARAMRAAAGADAAFIGNTTLGDGLPGGGVHRVALNNCVRFDGPLFVADVTGAELAAFLRDANQGPDTPFTERRGEFMFAAGPEQVSADRRYRIVTTDWNAKHRDRYFGTEAIEFTERPELRLKAVVAGALNPL